MKKALILFCMTALAAITASAQKPFPRGVMVVLPSDDRNIANEACWSDPNVIGVLLRTSWQKVQNSQSTIDWSYFNEGIALAQTHSKFVVLSVTAAVFPTWITSVVGVPIWTNTAGQSCPYPWDSNLEGYWNALIQSMGQNFDSVSCVHGVDMWAGGTGGNGTSASGIDCFFAPQKADCNSVDTIATGLGVTGPNPGNTLWNDACVSLCLMYVNAFPTTALFLHPGTNYKTLDPQSMSVVATWWLNYRPSLNSLFNNEFNENLPAYDSTLGFVPWPHTNFNINSVSGGMFQDLDALGTSRMTGQTLAGVFQNLYNNAPNVIAVQIYPGDPAKDPGEQTLINFNAYVGL